MGNSDYIMIHWDLQGKEVTQIYVKFWGFGHPELHICWQGGHQYLTIAIVRIYSLFNINTDSIDTRKDKTKLYFILALKPETLELQH